MQAKWLNRTLIASQCLTLCVNEKEYQSALNDLNISKYGRRNWINDGANATAHFFDGAGGAVVVCIDGYENTDPIEVCGILIHESVHIWQDFCRRIGEDCPSAEFEAYSIQMIAQRLMSSFKEKVCKQ